MLYYDKIDKSEGIDPTKKIREVKNAWLVF